MPYAYEQEITVKIKLMSNQPISDSAASRAMLHAEMCLNGPAVASDEEVAFVRFHFGEVSASPIKHTV